MRWAGESLSDAEILAIVLGNGCREVCSLDLAREILEEAGGLHGLVGVRADALQRRGLGEAKAASVLAGLEIARRLAEFDLPFREPLGRPYALVRYLYLNYAVPDQEVFGALYLSGRHLLIGEEELFRGSLCRATVEPRQILRSASGVVLFHYVPRHIMEEALSGDRWLRSSLLAFVLAAVLLALSVAAAVSSTILLFRLRRQGRAKRAESP